MLNSTPQHRALSVSTVPAFKDNYLWLIHDGVNAAVVDPGDAAPIRAALAAQKLRLTAILLTHHHADHIGGVPDLLREWDVPVFGPRNDGIAIVTHPLSQGDRIDVPGLTSGGAATVCVRPEQLRLGRAEDGGIKARVRTLVYFGTDTHCHLALSDGTEIVARLQSPASGEAGLAEGQEVGVTFEPGAVQRVEE